MPSMPSNAITDSITADDIQRIPPPLALNDQDIYNALKKTSPEKYYETGPDWQKQVAHISKR